MTKQTILEWVVICKDLLRELCISEPGCLLEPSAKGYGARHNACTNMQLKCKGSTSEQFQLLK